MADVNMNVLYEDKQSGTKLYLVAKILASNFGVLFVIHVYVMFSKYVQCESNQSGTKPNLVAKCCLPTLVSSL